MFASPENCTWFECVHAEKWPCWPNKTLTTNTNKQTAISDSHSSYWSNKQKKKFQSFNLLTSNKIKRRLQRLQKREKTIVHSAYFSPSKKLKHLYSAAEQVAEKKECHHHRQNKGKFAEAWQHLCTKESPQQSHFQWQISEQPNFVVGKWHQLIFIKIWALEIHISVGNIKTAGSTKQNIFTQFHCIMAMEPHRIKKYWLLPSPTQEEKKTFCLHKFQLKFREG